MSLYYNSIKIDRGIFMLCSQRRPFDNWIGIQTVSLGPKRSRVLLLNEVLRSRSEEIIYFRHCSLAMYHQRSPKLILCFVWSELERIYK